MIRDGIGFFCVDFVCYGWNGVYFDCVIVNFNWFVIVDIYVKDCD